MAPRLVSSAARNLQLAIPGTFCEGTDSRDFVRVAAFAPTLRVITSKQRPRVVVMHGSDGVEYPFLLKGHEDLRLDERVMQLFGLVNALLESDPHTHRLALEIKRYAVVPLSKNAGVMEWVPGCDTLQVTTTIIHTTHSLWQHAVYSYTLHS